MAILHQNITTLIDSWLEQEQNGVKFPVPFDIAWEIAGYADKGKGKRRLTSQNAGLIEGTDYYIYKGVPLAETGKSELSGRSGDKVVLSVCGFVKFLLVSQTPQATNIVFEMIEKLTGLAMGRVAHKNNPCGFVYLVKQSVNSYYKIGKSQNPYVRLQTLQTGTPLELTIVERYFSVNCGQLESLLHEYYQAYWVRGEWFDFPESIVNEFLSVARMLDGVVEESFLTESPADSAGQKLIGE